MAIQSRLAARGGRRVSGAGAGAAGAAMAHAHAHAHALTLMLMLMLMFQTDGGPRTATKANWRCGLAAAVQLQLHPQAWRGPAAGDNDGKSEATKRR
jgi:hypothetical protein